MSRKPAVRTLVLLLLLSAAAQAQTPAAAPTTAERAATVAGNAPELRLEQRLLSLDLVTYKETRQREGLARQRVTDVLARLDQALASDTVALGALEALQDELAVARGAAHTAEDRLNGQLDRLEERLRRIALLETDTGAPALRAADALTGRWQVTILPQSLTATFDLRLDGTVVSGTYQVNGSTAGSFRGTLAGNRLRMQRLDAQGGFDSTWEGIVDNGRITGSWMANELASGSPSRGDWTAVRGNGG
jgi:hypothetical protein